MSPYHSNYSANCLVPKEGHVGLFPAKFCVKLTGMSGQSFYFQKRQTIFIDKGCLQNKKKSQPPPPPPPPPLPPPPLLFPLILLLVPLPPLNHYHHRQFWSLIKVFQDKQRTDRRKDLHIQVDGAHLKSVNFGKLSQSLLTPSLPRLFGTSKIETSWLHQGPPPPNLHLGHLWGIF